MWPWNACQNPIQAHTAGSAPRKLATWPSSRYCRINLNMYGIHKARSPTAYTGTCFPSICINNQCIEIVTHSSLLGLEFHLKLSWTYHATIILSRMVSIAGIIYKLRNMLSYSWLINLYITFPLQSRVLLHCMESFIQISQEQDIRYAKENSQKHPISHKTYQLRVCLL